GCVPITKPGGTETWRMSFTNTGNLPQDRVYAVDRLPTPGDTGAILDLERGSQWTPEPVEVRYAGTDGGVVSQWRVYYTSDDELCIDDLDFGAGCADGAWTLIDTVDDPQVGDAVSIPADAVA